MFSSGTNLEKATDVLAVDDVVVDFGLGRGRTLRAVDHVSLELRAGEVLGIVGESGSGKSTLGRVVAGFQRPTSGQVRYPSADGLATRQGKRPHGHRDVQMIFQEAAMALNPRMPVWKLVGEARLPDMSTFVQLGRGKIAALRTAVAGDLERAGLSARVFAEKRASDLSGGEKQRVAIARALAASPVAMVCDESVAALDVSIRATVLNLFRSLSKDSGIALIFITHDISVVSHLADRVAVMYHGRVVEHGAARAVVTDPREDYTKRLIAAVPTLERQSTIR